MFCALWKTLDHFCPRSPALVTTVWGQCPDGGEGTSWHCKAQKSLSWLFSLLSPGRFWFAVRGTIPEQPGEHSRDGPQHVTLLAFLLALSLLIPLSKNRGHGPSLSSLDRHKPSLPKLSSSRALSPTCPTAFSYGALLSCPGMGQERNEDQAETLSA